ncbi:poly [ADP-ribose] polymerase tankyrase-like isoform X2 [Hydractinia symbiolongicarpus]|uniref:poly [ADP-ribose] polymerase tankyrase-like isoform X2 n=1 Tax=Hydractinia symbiolongicarpus TaxID=13093 RepID=UPI0025504B3E|nr:poly [ADP-ribose] polymerase tankyrase-like isoform X2 [Hydractinia symbiolongicarpus]
MTDVEMDALADTDTEDAADEHVPEQNSSIPKLFRLSSRIASLKRRGKHREPKETENEFEFYADDHVTVRAPNNLFYLAKILEDVSDETEQINVAWYDLVCSNTYKVSYDDSIYRATIITQVKVKEDKKSGLYFIAKQSLQETNQLLREAVGGVKVIGSQDNIGNVIEADSEKGSETEEPLKKRPRRSRDGKAKPGKPKGPSSAKTKTKIQKNLIPNLDIELLEKDPVFGEPNDIPLISVKWGIKSVLLDDMKELKRLHKDTANIYTVHWARSPHLSYGPVHYALLMENKEALKILHDLEDRDDVNAERPKTNLEEISTGGYDFRTFGHAVRVVTVSRGNQEGNNAFVSDNDGEIFTDIDLQLKFALKHNLSYDFIMWYFKRLLKMKDDELYDMMYVAIENGHYKLAGAIMTNAVKTDAYGYNFLHKEVLSSKKISLSKFRSPSITKKPYSKQIYPLHCACINPNVEYMQQLFAVLPEYTIPDYQQRGPIHYAAACEGDGPMKYLLSRGVDPNSHDTKLNTPLIIAAKTGRAHNIRALMDCTIDTENEEGENKIEKKVKINFKNKGTMTALHYAAERGFIDVVKVLIELGASIDLQTGAGKENMTPLGFAAQKGHYDVVKLLVEKGASPDKKMRRSKTALMYACMNGHSQIVAYLLRIGVNPSAEDSSQNTPIHYAAAYGWYHCVQLLLEGGANADKPNNWRTTPLAVSILKGHMEISELLLSVDVDVDYADEMGRTFAMKQVVKDFTDEMVKITKFLIKEKHSDVNKTDIEGWNILHHLASNSIYEDTGYDKNFPLVHCLLKNGADVSVGNTVNENEDILHLVLKNDDVNFDGIIDLEDLYGDEESKKEIESSTNHNWNNEIVKKISQKKLNIAWKEIVEALIRSKCSMNGITKKGETALLMSFSGPGDLTKLLLNHGANPLLGRNEFGENFLHVMARKCYCISAVMFLKEILKKYNLSEDFVNARENNGLTPLHLACMVYNKYRTHPEMEKAADFIATLLSVGKNINVAAQIGKKTEGINIRRRDILELSYQPNCSKENKCEFKEYCKYGLCTATHLLVLTPFHRTSNLLKEMLKQQNKTEVNRLDRYGRSPLHVCIKQKSLIPDCEHFEAMLKNLITAGADVNLLSGDKDEDHCATPLSLGTRNLSAVKVLLSASADPNKKDMCTGRTSISYAVENKNEETTLAILKCLLQAGGNVHGRDNEGRTALHYAVNATTGDYETLTEVENFLVDSGARRDLVDKFGRLPLHYAFTKMGRENDASAADPISIVNMLCDVNEKDLTAFGKGKEEELITRYINCADENGRTPLHLAALQGATLCCLHFKKMNASDTGEDCDGNTPLALALRGNHHGCAMILIQHGANVNCNITTPVSQSELKSYENSLKENIWAYKTVIKKPAPKTTGAFQIAIRNDWQGIAYLMMEIAGLPFIEVFKAAVSAYKPQLLWTIMKKQRNKEVFLVKSEDNKNLLHFLACAERFSDQAIPIAKLLVEAGVKGNDKDTNGATTLHYAASTNSELCEYIVDMFPQCVNICDNNGRTPLVYVLNDAKNAGKLDKHHVVTIRLLIENKAALDVAYQGDSDGNFTSVLNDIIALDDDVNFADETKHLSCLEYLLEKKIDVNFVPKNGKSAMMCAVSFNMEKKLQLLLKQKPRLDHQDENGNTCVHYCIQPNPYWSHENVNMLQMLIKAKAPFNSLNLKGETPLDLASRQKSQVMYKELIKRKAKSGNKMDIDGDNTQEPGFQFNTNISDYCDYDINVSVDADQEITDNIGETVQDINTVAKVDADIEIAETGEVYIDPITEVSYDAMLSKVDCRWGKYGLNLFYKLQIVCDKGRGLWILFNKWGRIGLRGQHQQTPYYTADEAVAEFKKIFKSKTGNDWEDIDTFAKKPKKYLLIRNEHNPEKMLQHHKQVLKPFDLKNSAQSKLPKELEEFMKPICDVTEICNLESYTQRSASLICFVKKEQTDLAKDVLAKIRKILEKLENSEDVFGAAARDSTETAYAEIERLSNEFFMLLPTDHHKYTSVQPINNLNALEEQEKNLLYVTELSSTMKILLAAQHKAKDINPLDYCFKALNCHIEVLAPQSEESQAILKSIYNNRAERKVTGIFRIDQPNAEYYAKRANKYLLWHGTKAVHLISLLRNGFQINPMYARNIGRRFGDGVYFSYEFAKAQDYTDYKNGFVLLCEVALGKITNKCWDPPASAHTLWLKKLNYPDPKDDITMPYGAKLLTGKLIPDPAMEKEDEDLFSCYDDENEIVARDPKQVKIRYIISLTT